MSISYLRKAVSIVIIAAFLFTPLEISQLSGDIKFLTGLTQCGMDLAAEKNGDCPHFFPSLSETGCVGANLRVKATGDDVNDSRAEAIGKDLFKLASAEGPAGGLATFADGIAGRVKAVVNGTAAPAAGAAAAGANADEAAANVAGTEEISLTKTMLWSYRRVLDALQEAGITTVRQLSTITRDRAIEILEGSQLPESQIGLLTQVLLDAGLNFAIPEVAVEIVKAVPEIIVGADVADQPIVAKGRTNVLEAQRLMPLIDNRRYGYVHDPQLRAVRVMRPGDYYKEEFGQPVGIFPSGFVASTIKLFRDIRKRGELERNVPNFRGIVQKTMAYLEGKTRSEEEENILAYFRMVDHIFHTTGLAGDFDEQVRQARELGELEQIQIQLKTEEEVKKYLAEQRDLIVYFMPHFAGMANEAFQAAIMDMSKAQGLYGENAVLAAYYRAFQLIAGITFPLDLPDKTYPPGQGPTLPAEESLMVGLTFLRSLYQANAVEELEAEQHYLSDTGPENYAANLTRILAEQNPLLVEAITGSGDLSVFVQEHKEALIPLLASEPFVGKTPAETRINIAGIPVDYFESGRPSGFTPLTLIAAMDGQIIQNVGNEKTRNFIHKIKYLRRTVSDDDIPEFLRTGAANLDWVVDMFEEMADRDLDGLTPVEQLYKAGGMALQTAAKRFSQQAYALYKMLVASDYILKAEETVKARQRPMVRQVVRTRGDSPRPQTPKVYIAALPEVYRILAEATRSQLEFLRTYFSALPATTPADIQERMQNDITKLEGLESVFRGLHAQTQSYIGQEVEQLVPIEDSTLAALVYNEWVETGNLANAKPVMFPAMEIGIFDKDSGFQYQGQVMFFVGGAWQGKVRSVDKRQLPFALYHLGRMVKRGGETITTAEHTLKINDQNNAKAYETDDGIKQLYEAEFVETYDPLELADKAAAPAPAAGAAATGANADEAAANVAGNTIAHEVEQAVSVLLGDERIQTLKPLFKVISNDGNTARIVINQPEGRDVLTFIVFLAVTPLKTIKVNVEFNGEPITGGSRTLNGEGRQEVSGLPNELADNALNHQFVQGKLLEWSRLAAAVPAPAASAGKSAEQMLSEVIAQQPIITTGQNVSVKTEHLSLDIIWEKSTGDLWRARILVAALHRGLPDGFGKFGNLRVKLIGQGEVETGEVETGRDPYGNWVFQELPEGQYKVELAADAAARADGGGTIDEGRAAAAEAAAPAPTYITTQQVEQALRDTNKYLEEAVGGDEAAKLDLLVGESEYHRQLGYNPQERLAAFIDGLVPEEERLRIEAHLSVCPFCREEVAETRQLIAAMAEAAPLGGAPAPAAAPAAELTETEIETAKDKAANRMVLVVDENGKGSNIVVHLVTEIGFKWENITLEIRKTSITQEELNIKKQDYDLVIHLKADGSLMLLGASLDVSLSSSAIEDGTLRKELISWL